MLWPFFEKLKKSMRRKKYWLEFEIEYELIKLNFLLHSLISRKCSVHICAMITFNFVRERHFFPIPRQDFFKTSLTEKSGKNSNNIL